MVRLTPSARKRLIFLVLALAVLGVGAMAILKRPAPFKVLTGEVSRGSLDASVSATGTVNPVMTVHVGSQISGTVLHLYADYNSQVRQGQLLLQLDPAIYNAQVAQARANLEKARSDLENQRRIYARAQEMFKKNFSSKADMDAAQTAFESAGSTVKQVQASVDLAMVNLAHCTIYSPINGTVISRSVDVGQTVAASLQAPELFLIANDLTKMQVETAIDEADIGKIHPDQPVTFSVDAFPDAQFHGHVTQIRQQPITVQNVVTYTTVIEVGNPEQKLRPGMTANVSILVARRDDVLKVPNAALRFKPSADVSKLLGLKPEEKGRMGGAVAAGNGQRESTGTASASGSPAPGMAGGGAATGDSARARKWQRMGGAQGGPSDSMRAAWRREHGGAGDSNGGGQRRARTAPVRVYVQVAPGQVKPVVIKPGLSDGSFTEVLSGDLQVGQTLVTGVLTNGQSKSLSPPPGFGGPGGGGGGRGR